MSNSKGETDLAVSVSFETRNRFVEFLFFGAFLGGVIVLALT